MTPYFKFGAANPEKLGKMFQETQTVVQMKEISTSLRKTHTH